MPASLLSFTSVTPAEDEDARNVGYADSTNPDEVFELARAEFGGEIFDFSCIPLTADNVNEGEAALFAANPFLSRFTYATKPE